MPGGGSRAVEDTHEEACGETEEEAGDILELELPMALRELLQNLRGSSRSGAKAVESIPDLSWEIFGNFFVPRRRISNFEAESPTRSEVRLKVLAALGNCKTLRTLNSKVVDGWNLSVAEWEALLIPMQGNPQLEEIEIVPLESPETEARVAPHFHNIVRRAHNLQELRLPGGLSGFVKAKLAAEVALGLRGNVHQKLKSLYVDFGFESDDASVVVHAADIISSASQLRELFLTRVPRLDGVAKEALSAAWKRCCDLREVQIDVARVGVADVLGEVYGTTRPSSGPSMERLRLISVEGLTGEILAGLTGSNIITIEIKACENCFGTFNREQWQRLGRSLRQPVALRTLRIHLHMLRLLESLGNGLEELWEASERSSVLHISLLFNGSNRSTSNLFKLMSPYYVMEHRKQDVSWQRLMSPYYVMEHRKQDVSWQRFNFFLEKLVENTSIREIEIIDFRCDSPGGWANIFLQLLNGKMSIRKLNLTGCDDLTEDDFRGLMELLQVNLTVQTVDISKTQWERDGKKALVQEVLERNKKHASYLSILGGAGLPFGGAKAGRVFICGSPNAGKTELKITMMKTVGKKSESESLVSTFKEKGKQFQRVVKRWLQRTKGIEIELLCDDEFISISLWDLAGQAIFRALQSILFPRVSQACIFVFVFNPFEGKGKCRSRKKDLVNSFDKELGSWLRFVVSNTQITGPVVPQMLIIITHRDKLKESESKFLLGQLEVVVKKFQDLFEGFVDLCPRRISHADQLMYHVNAKATKEVQPVTELIISCMKDVLRRKSPRVPRACSELVSHLLQGSKEVQSSPLWYCEKFYNFCSIQHSLLSNFTATDERGRKILHAVASYMHDTGAICMTPSSMDLEDTSLENPKKSIVVDMNWLTQNFLGELIGEGHQFRTQSGASTMSAEGFREDQDGVIDPMELYKVIDKILGRKSRGDVNRIMVIELLFELDLCFRITSKNGRDTFFMPMLFGGNEEIALRRMSHNQLPWGEEFAEGSDYFGFRVQCRDKERTSLSPAFYPRYQIHLRKQMRVLGVTDDTFTFSRYHAKIRVNGCIILVEIDEAAENHIDIMVKFSKAKSQDWAMDFIYEHVVTDLITFSASEKGCPGLQLVVSLLRTECVKRLTPRHLREAQAVLIEELKTLFRNDIESQLEKEGLESKQLFGFMHTWPEIQSTEPDFSLGGESQRACTLLSSKDVQDVLTAVGKQHEDLWKDLSGLRQVRSRLNDAAHHLQLILHTPTVSEKSNSKNLSIHERQDTQSLASIVCTPPCTPSNIYQGCTPVQQLLLSEMHEIKEGMHHMERKIMTRLEQMTNDFRNYFKSSVDEMHSEMSLVISKMDTIIGLSKSMDAHKTPTRPYFTVKDVSRMQKIKGLGTCAKPVQLHLMCESRQQQHFVENQPGLELYFEKGDPFSKSMRTLSVISFKMVWVLLKVGAQVTAGLGSVIPVISDIETGLSVGVGIADLVLDRLESEMKDNLILLQDSPSINDAWCHLRNYLAEHLTDEECAKKFMLHKVRYRNSNDPYAWLCESCIVKARRNFLLE